jgi:predicted GNAT family acetyltransferase
VIYTRAGDRITLVHTIVPPALEGRGVGSALVRYALDAARAQGWRVVPECPFVRAYRRRHPDDLAFVPPDARVAIAPGAGPGDAGLPT